MHIDATTVGLHQILHNGQAQSRTCLSPGSGFIRFVKPFKNEGKIFFWDPLSRILDGDKGPPLIFLNGNRHDPVTWSVSDGIIDEVG